MKREVRAAVDFLKRLALERGGVVSSKADVFARKLTEALCERYAEHWYPDQPSKGQAFRCIRMNRNCPCDGSIEHACTESQLTPADLGFPPEITLWIDPLEVCARSGENSRHFTVARFSEGQEEEVEEVEVEEKKENIINSESPAPDTSDYHSASSSDCGSADSSDTEEDQQRNGQVENKKVEKEKIKTPARTSKPRRIAPSRYVYQTPPPPLWTPYKRKAPVFVTAMCAPPPAPVYGFYVLHKAPPQFIIPHATLQPRGGN